MNDLETARACADLMYARDTASQALGIEIEIGEPGSAIATMTVRADMTNGFDICHGGLIFTVADTAFAFACNAYDNLTVAASGSIDFLRPVRAGDRLRAEAREVHRTGRTGLYAVEVFNQRDERVALFQGRAAARGKHLLDG